MRKIIRSSLLVLAIIIFSNNAWVTLTLLHPAIINVPQHIKTLAIIDRTVPEDNKKNIIEQAITGEIFKQDEQAVQKTFDGVISTITNSPRFKIKRTTDKYVGSTSGTTFPNALSWSTIEQLCEKHKVDGIISVETFDSDFIITNGSKKIDKKDNDGNIIPSIEYYAEGVATVNIGFRLYDPISKEIIDQYQYSENMTWNANGNSAQSAITGMLDKVSAINEVSYYAGEVYASRITPTWYKVTRYFYDTPKKNKKLVEGVRKSEVADWEGAIESWKQALDKDAKDKYNGRILYNIAVGYEVLKDFEKAKKWASRAYTEYGEKKADDYIRDLNNRINNEAILKQQLPED